MPAPAIQILILNIVDRTLFYVDQESEGDKILFSGLTVKQSAIVHNHYFAEISSFGHITIKDVTLNDKSVSQNLFKVQGGESITVENVQMDGTVNPLSKIILA